MDFSNWGQRYIKWFEKFCKDHEVAEEKKLELKETIEDSFYDHWVDHWRKFNDFSSFEEELLIYLDNNDISSDTFQWCCGVAEIEVESLRESYYNVNSLLKAQIGLHGVTGLILTQSFKKKNPVMTGLEADLSKITIPKYLGKNPKTDNHIYIWVISKEELLTAIKNEEENIKRTKKVQASNKIKASKSRSSKKRVASSAF